VLTKTGRDRTYAVAAAVVLLLAGTAYGQTARSIGMGGVVIPGRSAAGANPAYAAVSEDTHVTLTLPLGLIGVVSAATDLLDGQEPLDAVIPLYATLGSLNTYLFALPPGVLGVTFDTSIGDDGLPIVSIDLAEDSAFDTGAASWSAARAAELPLRIPAGPVTVGVRPYLTTGVQLELDRDLRAIFGAGTSRGSARGTLSAESGVAIDVAFATQVPTELLGSTEDAAAQRVYVGVRGGPVVGLAKAAGSATVTVEAVLENGEPTYQGSYAGDLFVSDVVTDGVSFGVLFDVGFVIETDMEGGTATFGAGITGAGLGVWRGSFYELEGVELEGGTLPDPIPATRTLISSDLGVLVNGAYASSPSPSIDLLVAGDAGYRAGRLQAHLGAEGTFHLADATRLAARAGVGLEDGLRLGVGAGITTSEVTLDVGLSLQRVPFTQRSVFGVSASLGFPADALRATQDGSPTPQAP
jgi:hypothetical protein